MSGYFDGRACSPFSFCNIRTATGQVSPVFRERSWWRTIRKIFWKVCAVVLKMLIYFFDGNVFATLKSGFVFSLPGEVLAITGSSAEQRENQDGKMTISYKEGILPSWI